MYTIMVVVMIVTLVIYFVGLFVRKYIGVEMIAVVQLAYVGAIIVDYWPPLFSVFAELHHVNGYNLLF